MTKYVCGVRMSSIMIDAAIEAFIRQHADKGRDWIALRLDLAPQSISVKATQ